MVHVNSPNSDLLAPGHSPLALESSTLPDSLSTQAESLVAPSQSGERPHKYTLCFTQRCNLACPYCYIHKTGAVMSQETAHKVVDFIFRHSRRAAGLEIGFFGGEPLLEFGTLQSITRLIQDHPAYDPARVRLSLTTNGTIFSDAIIQFLLEHDIKFCISCDGPPEIQNTFRHTKEGAGSSSLVEGTIRQAISALPVVLVNAVFHPRTFRRLPETVDYFAGLGVRHLYLNPDFSARWTQAEVDDLPRIYQELTERYIAWYLAGDPHFISLLDSKITALLRGGFDPMERCRMGSGELAFSPDGGIYPCERLIGDGFDGAHRIGHVETGLDFSRMRCHVSPGTEPLKAEDQDAAGKDIASLSVANPECRQCGIRDYCMNWCGCSNTFMTGYYNRTGPFLCASERALTASGLHALKVLGDRMGSVFLHHLLGSPHTNSRLNRDRADCSGVRPSQATPLPGPFHKETSPCSERN